MIKTNAPELSYWEATQFFKGIDLLIVGSGIVGLNAAIFAKEKAPNLQVLLIDRGPLPSGASTRNAGFACFGSPTELLDDLREQSETEVFELVAKRWKGLTRLRERLGDKNIAYKEWGGFELFRTEDQEAYEECQEKMAFLNQELAKITGRPAIYQNVDQQLSQFGFAGVEKLMVNTAEGQIDTGKMMKSLIAKARAIGVEIINGLGLVAFQSGLVGVDLVLDNGWELRVPRVLIATNGFAKQLLPELEVLPARNQVLITKPIAALKIKGCFHYDRGYYYFRNIDARILFGGGRSLAPEEEQTNTFGTTSLIQKELLKLLEEMICPNQKIEIEQWWSGILGVGPTKKPIVKSITSRVAVAVRMGGMGIAIGSLVGEEGAELLV